ncbi:AAA family ATPase [Lamprocystis purpurea]|jgi:predicted ATPase|uniref:AAA family ATPase n=1 Tax=Lamprocystis purpurea TaxID=61598 RepID=UPI00036D9AB0|nr:AAA family ATPase [Lamprocystis purpurea]
MLTSLRLTDFKSFRDQTIPLAPLTVLVGANASGKSNFFDAVRFLQGIGINLSISEILLGRREGGREVWPGLRGGIVETVRAGCDRFAIESIWDLHWHIKENQQINGLLGSLGEHRITCRGADTVAVIQERLAFPDRGTFLFDTDCARLWGDTGLTDGLDWFGQVKGAKSRAHGVGWESPLSLLGLIKFSPIPGLPRSVPEYCHKITDSMAACAFPDISPAAMRDYRPRESEHLGDQGENISPVLLRLCQDQGLKADLLDWLSELCAPTIEDIGFDITGQGEIRFELIESGGVRISARSLSEGTLRFLGLIVSLLTAQREPLPMPVMLIEEIENGLHPTRLHLLVELLEQVTKSGRVQVIATTHSPLVLQHLSHEALGNAVVFGRIPDEPGTVARRLRDLRNFDEVAARRGVDRLFATGWLERAL